MKTKIMNKSISLFLVLATMVSCCAVFFTVPVSAESVSFPSISQSNYIETKAEVSMPVYRDEKMTVRGTSSPSKCYNAVIDQWDTVRIIKICGNNAVLVEYPTSSGWRRGYCAFSNFFNYKPNKQFTATSSATVYTAPYGSSYGTIVKGDTVYRVGESNGYVLVVYQAKSGNRGYKLGYIQNASYDKIQKQESMTRPVSSTSSSAYTKLTDMKNGTYTDVYKVNTVYSGPYWDEECKGFAKSVFEQLYGYNIGSTCSKTDGVNYQLKISTSKTMCLGSVTQMKNNTASQDNIKNLFLKASAGDFVQMRRQHTGSHSAIVYSVTEKGVTFFEANIDNNNGIYLETYTWEDLCNDNSAMSIYRDK